MFGFRMVGSGLSKIQRSKGQEGRYGGGGRCRSFPGFIRLANTEKTYFIRPIKNHRILLIEWEIFETNSSEFNEPCHEIHQNSNSDNCHQETDF